ncbi:uncharacterized protein LOC125721578 [Brienomyrus brachyistius]|uniref:uncharacterized protein LOC125721578 n=1 Tax=Brienomyrus brachyistius TaxID=42636 RepID=UPI0020B4087E|nr:uncharacterized protein LOC125721578 [Brienomyrus brachyistius]
MAGTLTRSDGVILTDVVLGLGEAMREMFPAPIIEVGVPSNGEEAVGAEAGEPGTGDGAGVCRRGGHRRELVSGVGLWVIGPGSAEQDRPKEDPQQDKRLHPIHRLFPEEGRGADPMLSLKVMDKELPFLVDTGATYSTLNVMPNQQHLSTTTVTVVGFSGEEQKLPVTKPVRVRLGGQTFLHPFVVSAAVPVNLLGRDMLVKLGASILCNADGLVVTLPEGTRLPCDGATGGTGQWLMQPVSQHPVADIYWGLLQPSPAGILAVYSAWRSWISLLEPYVPPPDPPHVTLFYDRNSTEWYGDLFSEQLEGHEWQVASQNIYVGPEGVASAVHLSPEQLPWYRMGEEAVPHVSLALHPKHQAKDLGPMVKRATSATDWVLTQIPQISYSPSCSSYCIQTKVTDTARLQHEQLSRDHGREKMDHPGAAALLASLPNSLWSTSPTDVGLVDCTPVDFLLHPSAGPLWVKQYQHKPAAEEGIAETVAGLLRAGVLEGSTSQWNTPILPVEKAGTGKYRMAHDLRAINELLLTPTVPVPNPYVALTNLTPSQTWFTCIDLANAFFSVPLAPHCRDVFSFTYRGCQFRYTRLPQGFALSPGIFNQVLKQSLQGCHLPDGVTLVQYVDDLLIAAPTAEAALEATRSVLLWLAEKGFKVSKDKIQVARTVVSFLGRVLSGKGTGLSPAHRSAILSHPKPIIVKDMLSFLGLTGYSRTYIADYTGLTQPLRALVRPHGLRSLSATLTWDQPAEEAFITLKQRLAQAADLALPDYSLPFHLDVSETGDVVNAVLFQKKGGERKVLMYISTKLDTTEQRHPSCTRHVAGVAKAVQKTAHIVMGHALHILTTHSVVAYVNSQTFTMTSLRQQRLSKILEAPHLTFVHEGINMADRMGGGAPHECEARVRKEEKVREDLAAEQIEGTEEWFTDGCCFRTESGSLQAGFAVVAREGLGFRTLKAERLEGAQSAQRAEIRAVIEALKVAEGKEVTLYSDSAYAVGAVHVELSQWLRAGFLTAGNKPIKHEADMRELAEALMLPEKIAVVKCKGHEGSGTVIAQGNQAADAEAKVAAGYEVSRQMVTVEEELEGQGRLTSSRIRVMQAQASPEEKNMWAEKGGIETEGLWCNREGKPALPMGIRQQVIEEAHGVGHVGTGQMLHNLRAWWHPFLKDMVKEFVRSCEICALHNPRPTVKPEKGQFPACHRTGEEIVLDYTDMIIPVRGMRYVLMCVDAFSGWPEAWPTRREDGASVVKFLVNHYIPKHGFPERVRSDNGSHFKSEDLQKAERALGLKHAFGTVYHPQSQGKVERMNQTVKQKLAKICAQTKLNWVEALPLALMSIRCFINRGTGFTPFELQTGRQFPGPYGGLEGKPEQGGVSTAKAYYEELQVLVKDFSKQVQETRPGAQPAKPHTAEWVLLKVIKRKWSEPRWTGPFQVTERTSHAVRLKGKGETWYHWSQCAAVAEPSRSLAEIQEDLADSAKQPGSAEPAVTQVPAVGAE